jgi:hypothetical protein
MWLSFGIRPAKNEHKRLPILKLKYKAHWLQADGLRVFYLTPKVGNSFQTSKQLQKKKIQFP